MTCFTGLQHGLQVKRLANPCPFAGGRDVQPPGQLESRLHDLHGTRADAPRGAQVHVGWQRNRLANGLESFFLLDERLLGKLGPLVDLGAKLSGVDACISIQNASNSPHGDSETARDDVDDELTLGMHLLELTLVLRLQLLHDRHLHGVHSSTCRPAPLKVANDRVSGEEESATAAKTTMTGPAEGGTAVPSQSLQQQRHRRHPTACAPPPRRASDRLCRRRAAPCHNSWERSTAALVLASRLQD